MGTDRDQPLRHRRSEAMRKVNSPATSRGRRKHVIAVLVTADTTPLEVVVTQQIFGPPVAAIADVTAEKESPYEVVLCGEAPRYVLPNGVDPGDLSGLDVLVEADTVIVPGVQNPLAEQSAE